MSKQSIDSFLESSLGMKFFQRSVCSAERLLHLYPFDNQSTLFPFICSFCFVCAFSFQDHTKIALLGLLEKVFELLVTMTKHVRNLFNNDFVML